MMTDDGNTLSWMSKTTVLPTRNQLSYVLMLTIAISAAKLTVQHMKQLQRVRMPPMMEGIQYQDGVKRLFGKSIGSKEGKIFPQNNIHASIQGVGLGIDKNVTNCAPNRGSLPRPDPVDTHDERTAHSRKDVSTNAEGLQEPVGTNQSQVTLIIEDTLRPVGIHTAVGETVEPVGTHQNTHDERTPRSCKDTSTNVEGLQESVGTNRAQVTLSIEDMLRPVDVHTAVGETVGPVGTHQTKTIRTPIVGNLGQRKEAGKPRATYVTY
jgi:hypothetical protein